MKEVKIIMVTRDEFGEEKEKVIKRCKNIKEAERFILEYEQDFADNPEVYYIGIKE